MSINYELLIHENTELLERITKIELELAETKEHLNVYKASPEQKKEYARTAYLNKKAKLQKLKEINTLETI